ncbi:uncharacterized protein LOC107772374 isoform X4 [Nicotiana tabacum]|uniref:Uncharacterized protein LOC107772374 isoform X4 n=1 Tax=Nicotiana tabacum TaxID=4097 RepID=A0A1S3Y639_TOBAC|nr:PREDICTED: uncharacterized protein LOC107772374 isoform X4 [Nicotiana tabacum]
MASEMNEVMSALHKISTEMSSFTARQEQLEAAQEQSSKQQKESLNELREVLNEVIHEGKRPERDKKASQDEAARVVGSGGNNSSVDFSIIFSFEVLFWTL